MFPDLSALYPPLSPLPQLLLHTPVFKTGFLTFKQAAFLAGTLRPEKPNPRLWHKANRLSAEGALDKLIKLGLMEQASIPSPPYFRRILLTSPTFKWTNEERDLVSGRAGDESSIVDFEADTELEFLDRGERSVYHLWKSADHRAYEVTNGPPGVPLLHLLGFNNPWRGSRCIDVFLPTPAACELRGGLPSLPVWDLEVGEFYSRFMPEDEPPRPPLANPPKRTRRNFSIRAHVSTPFKPDRLACHWFNVSNIYFGFLDYLPDREVLKLKQPKDPLTKFYPLRKKAEVAERWVSTGCPHPADLLRIPVDRDATGQGLVCGDASPNYRANRDRWTLRVPDAYILNGNGRPHTAVAFGITYSEQFRRKFYSFCREQDLDCWMF